MPYADKEKQAEYNKTYNKQWYEDNKQKRSEQVKEQKRRRKKEWDAFKASVECAHCGTSGRPEVIDFHHVDKDDLNNIKVYKLVQGDNYNGAMREVKERCIPLCSNCHRTHHAKEFTKNQD